MVASAFLAAGLGLDCLGAWLPLDAFVSQPILDRFLALAAFKVPLDSISDRYPGINHSSACSAVRFGCLVFIKDRKDSADDFASKSDQNPKICFFFC